MDKTSTRVIVTIAICCLSIFARGIMNGFGSFYAVMFLLGIGQGIIFPGVNKVIGMWFGRQDLFKAMAILTSGAPIGMICGFNLSIPFSSAVGGWQNMYMIFGGVGVAFAVVWLIVMRDIPAVQQELNKQLGIDTKKNSVWENLKGVLSQKQAWIIVISEFFYQGFMQTVIAFGATVVGQFPGVTPQIAGTASSMGCLLYTSRCV